MPVKPPVGTIAIGGFNLSGKTLLLSLLTKIDYQELLNLKQINTFTVTVPHPNLEELHSHEGKEKKIIFPTVEFVDSPGLLHDNEEANHHSFSILRSADAIIIVLDACRNKTSVEQLDEQKEMIKKMFVQEDIRILTRQCERISQELSRDQNNKELQVSRDKFTSALEELRAGNLDKVGGYISPEIKLLSKQQIFYIANLSEENITTNYNVDISIPLKLEYDINALDSDEDKKSFMEEYGINELKHVGLERLIYNKLGFIMFFTPGKKDVTAWGIKDNTTAIDAAAVIHTDIARGFINCEVTSWDDYRKELSVDTCRHKGYVSKKDKNYLVKDSDILNFNFNATKKKER